jgi:hypothetical protein
LTAIKVDSSIEIAVFLRADGDGTAQYKPEARASGQSADDHSLAHFGFIGPTAQQFT